ncbi:hypothetical protein GCM10020218_095060 [Dactylosporangium vinaceum]
MGRFTGEGATPTAASRPRGDRPGGVVIADRVEGEADVVSAERRRSVRLSEAMRAEGMGTR